MNKRCAHVITETKDSNILKFLWLIFITAGFSVLDDSVEHCLLSTAIDAGFFPSSIL